MDNSRFDALTMAFSAVRSRRETARLFAIGAAAALGLREIVPASGRVCRQVGDHCGTGIKGHCCPGTSCRKGRKGHGHCVCRPGLTECGGYCFDINSDPLGCGATCVVCPKDTDCCNGVCCPAGQRCCGGECRDLTADNHNCGGCTQECPAGLTCCDSRCRDIQGDTRHCGRCDASCATGESCVNGQCACQAPNADCGDGICRNFQSDAANCGACGVRCGLNQICRGGQCECRTRYRRCGVSNPDRCGLPDNAVCERNEDCCLHECQVSGGVGHCQPCLGELCEGSGYDFQCCGGLTCQVAPQPNLGYYCGGCVGLDWYCTNDADCCFSDCTGSRFGTCVSLAGGRCASNLDCRACYIEDNCTNACVDGRCRV